MTDDSRPVVFDAAPGRRIAGYEIEAEIGRGGMAVVYRARDVNLDRTVALKLLAPQLAQDDSFRQRFIHESRSAASVDHPNIIPVFEAGDADGALFIAMRFVSTGDLRRLLERSGPLPVTRVVSIIGQVASALDAAHARGLVHRDVKPANMLLAPGPDGMSDHVYLSDFGLSKQSLAPTGLTGSGQFLGTLDYVAPEQIEGRPVDGRADLYALACATMEMLTGAPPFRRAENVALMYAQLSEPPPSLVKRRPELSPAVDHVMFRALAKAPGDRFPGCADFAAALRSVCLAPPARPMAPGGGGRPPTQLAGYPAGAFPPPGPGGPGPGGPGGFGAGGPGAGGPGMGGHGAGGPVSPAVGGRGPGGPVSPAAGMGGPGGPGSPAAGMPGPGRPMSPGTGGPVPGGPVAGRAAPGRAVPGGPVPGGPVPGRGGPGGPVSPAAGLPAPVPQGGLAGQAASGLPESWFRGAQGQASPAAPPSGWPADPRHSPAGSQPRRQSQHDPTALLPPDRSYVPGAGGSYPPGGAYPGSSFPPGGPGSSVPPPGTRGRRRGWGMVLAIMAAIVIALILVGLAFKLKQNGGTSGSPPPAGVTSSSGSATAASSAPAVSTPVAPGPAQTVQRYYGLINEHRYAAAWALGGKNSGNTYASYVSGYSDTTSSVVSILAVRGSVVTARLTATHTDGSVHDFAGTYTVHEGEITAFAVHPAS